MKKITLLEQEYEVITDFKNGFDATEVISKFTDYFEPYDYILGDWSYGKMRLKGFCDKENKIFNSTNDFTKTDEYLENNCAFECKYFILKKII